MIIDFIKREIMPNLVYYLIAGLCMGLGIATLKSNQVITGGFPGLSLILNYFLDYSVGTLLFMLNVPLFIFGYYVKGAQYFLRVLICTLILSVMTDGMIWLLYDILHGIPLMITTVFGGIIIGIGITFFVTNGGNPGGLMILSQWISERLSIPLGYIIMAQDLIITGLGIGNILTWQTWIYSYISIAVTSLTMLVLSACLKKS